MFVLNRDDKIFRIPCAGRVPVESLPAAVERSARRHDLHVSASTEATRLPQRGVLTAAKLTCGRLPVVYVVSLDDERHVSSALEGYSSHELRSGAALNYFSLLENKILGSAVADLLADGRPFVPSSAALSAQGHQTVVIGSMRPSSEELMPVQDSFRPPYTVTVDERRVTDKPAVEMDRRDDSELTPPRVQRELLYVSRADALSGCVKELVLDDGRRVRVPVPSYAQELSRITIPNAGALDHRTGVRGVLEVQIVFED